MCGGRGWLGGWEVKAGVEVPARAAPQCSGQGSGAPQTKVQILPLSGTACEALKSQCPCGKGALSVPTFGEALRSRRPLLSPPSTPFSEVPGENFVSGHRIVPCEPHHSAISFHSQCLLGNAGRFITAVITVIPSFHGTLHRCTSRFCVQHFP